MQITTNQAIKDLENLFGSSALQHILFKLINKILPENFYEVLHWLDDEKKKEIIKQLGGVPEDNENEELNQVYHRIETFNDLDFFPAVEELTEKICEEFINLDLSNSSIKNLEDAVVPHINEFKDKIGSYIENLST